MDPAFLQYLINGITLGAVYGLIALGYTMVYGIIGMINFAHGEIYMMGAYVALIILTACLNLPVVCGLLFALLVGSLAMSAYAWTMERLAYRPLRGSFRMAPLISAIGLSIFFQNYVQLFQGARAKTLAPVITGGITLMEKDGFTVQISTVQILIIVLTATLMAGFHFLVNKTSLGRQQRACSQDMKTASLMGVDVNRVVALTFIMGAILAAMAGLMTTLYYGVVNFNDGFLPGMKAFTAAVLGGIGSIPGAILGGLLIGIIESLWSGFFSSDYKDIAAFSILVLVLIFKPSGFLGRSEVEKV